MKKFTFLFTLLPQFLFGQSVQTRPYYQDVAVHHTMKQGMPDAKMSAVLLDQGLPVVTGENQTLKWDGQKWGETKYEVRKMACNIPKYPENWGRLLASVEYNQGFALYFQEVGGGRSEQEGTFFLLPCYMALYHQLIK